MTTVFESQKIRFVFPESKINNFFKLAFFLKNQEIEEKIRFLKYFC